jgi:hypothetical protein
MTISYNLDTNIITISGGTVDTPLTFSDIYNVDVANNWGVFTKYGDRNYKSSAKLLFSDCVFKDSYVSLLLENLGKWGWDYICKFTTGANCEFESISFYNYEPVFECGYRAEYSANIVFSNCAFYSHLLSKRVLFTGSPDSLIFDKCYSELYYTGIKAVFRDSIIGGRYGHIASPNSECVFDNLNIDTKNGYCYWFPAGSFTVSGGRYNADSKLAYLRNANSVNIKNAELEKSNITVYNDTEGFEGLFKISYDYTVKLLDIEGSPTYKNVKIVDAYNNVLLNEVISEKTIELPIYSLDLIGSDSPIDYTIDDYKCHLPYTITVSDEITTYYNNKLYTLNNTNKLSEITIEDKVSNISDDITEIKRNVRSIKSAINNIGIF